MTQKTNQMPTQEKPQEQKPQEQVPVQETQEQTPKSAQEQTPVQETQEQTPKSAPKPKKEAKKAKPSYVPEPGSEQMVHLVIKEGSLYDHTTGLPLSKPRVQIFTYSEWQLLKESMSRLGVTIKEVLHDPYGEAEAFVTPKAE